MNKWVEKNAVAIVMALVSFGFGVSGDTILKSVFPDASAISKEFIREIIVEVVQEEIEPMKADIKEIKEQNKIFADDIAEEWVRFMKKQYLKVQTERDDLSWSDVAYTLSKWNVLPDNWKTPELTSKKEYLELKYNEHINTGT